jgi:hypothetical protein
MAKLEVFFMRIYTKLFGKPKDPVNYLRGTKK